MGAKATRKSNELGAGKQASSQIDRHVGARVRMRRLLLEMSQNDVASQLGLTYQQFQKYEAGINRISASKLHQIADILEVPPSFFFEDLAQPDGGERLPTREWPLIKFVATSEGLSLAKAFKRIREPAIKRAIIVLVEEIAGPEKSSPPGSG